MICSVLLLASLGLAYASEGTISISVGELDNGVTIQNSGSVACIAFVDSPGGDQRFELATGESLTVTDISQPIDVSAVCS